LGRQNRQNLPRTVRLVGARELLPVTGSADERIATVAGVQRGRVSRSQLLEAGLSRHAIAWMLASGRLIRLHAGVYAVGHMAEIPLGREVAALLACGPGSVLSHLTACGIWNSGGGLPNRSTVDVTMVACETSRRRTGVVTHRSKLITHADVVVVHRLRVTSPAWTLLDLAKIATEREAERALDEALARRLVSLTKLNDLLARTKLHGGQRPLGRLVRSHERPRALTRSEAEERMLALIRGANLPPAQLNVQVCGYEVDFYWPEKRLVIEVDGYAWHSSRTAFERDRHKGIALAGAGIELVRVSWRQIVDEPLALIAGIAARLVQQSPR
jgi:very-short-patch-repair endonuclease